MNGLNNLITHYVCYLEKEISCDIETLSIYRVFNKKYFYGKNYAENVKKASPRPLFNFNK